MMDAWQAMDDWCRDQGRRLQDRANPHVEKGGSLDDPEYRRLLGQSQGFLKMRSFIHGHRGADDALRDDAEPMMPDAAFLGWLAGVLRSREFQSELVAERLERIASRLRSPSPDGEVTEEMIEAGETAYIAWNEGDQSVRRSGGMVRAIFKAMISARSGG